VPTKELIASIEDRQFTSGLGNWAGFDYWYAGPYQGRSGMGAVIWPPGTVTKNLILSYPACRAPAASLITFDHANVLLAPGGTFFLFTYHLLDGNYDLLGIDQGWEDPLGWIHPRTRFTTPADWNQSNTSIKAILLKDDPVQYIGYFDDNTLYMQISARPDHLPLMGVH